MPKTRLETYSTMYSNRRRGSLNLLENRNQRRQKQKQLTPSQSVNLKTVQCLLSTVGDWDFNIFTLDKLTNGRPLFHLGLHLFQEYNLINIFQLDIVKLMRCLTLIEEGYHGNNPYHNVVHAADVVQAMHCFLQEKQVSACVNPLEVMIALLSSATHDLDHPGVNQAFLIATSNHLAALYKNSSVLENHHWRSAIGILHESALFDHLDMATWQTIEWQLKSLILATDITRQPEFLQRLRKQRENNNLNLRDEENRHFMLQIALKCADISNPCRGWEVSRRWSQLVCDEFFLQGDNERKLQLPVTPVCNRYNTTVALVQTGFIAGVVGPLFREWQQFSQTAISEKMLVNTQKNKQAWDKVIKEAKDADEMKVKEDNNKTQHKQSNSKRQVFDDSDLSSEEENKTLLVESVQIHDQPKGLSVDATLFSEENSVSLYGQRRRHSMPPPIVAKDFNSLLQQNRENLPRGLQQIKRRHSLPTKAPLVICSSTEKLSDKLARVVEAGSMNNSNSTLYSTVENIENPPSPSSQKILEVEQEQEGYMYKKFTGRRKSEPERLMRLKATDTDFIVSQIQKAARFGRPAWKDNNTLSDLEQAALVRNMFNRRGSNGNLRTNSSNMGLTGRQVLRPLNGNSRVAPMNNQFGSGNEAFFEEEATGATIAVNTLTCNKIPEKFHDRPRSLSLDTRLGEIHPQLLQRLQEHVLGESDSINPECVSLLPLGHPPAHASSHSVRDSSEHLLSAVLYEDESASLTTPLLSKDPNTTLVVHKPPE